MFKGYLFVGDVLLNECGMENHPLTPMTDANLVRVLAAQCRGEVGLVPHTEVARGAGAIRAAFAGLREQGRRHAVVDALDDSHLESIGEACAELALVTGGSGVALGLPANFRRAGLLEADVHADSLPRIEGAAAVLAGSCSRATLEQVARAKALWPSYRIEPLALADALAAGEDPAAGAVAFARDALADGGPVLVYASAPPDEVRAAQERLGRERAGALIEQAMAGVARTLVELGVRRLVVAGGETAGAVVNALGVRALRIGAQIDPGVPWTASMGEPALALALKSGNFGTADFFSKALQALD